MMQRNGQGPTTVHEAAREYFRRGWVPVELHPSAKVPVEEAYLDLRPTEDDLKKMFQPETARNIGVLTGTPSQLLDVDLDSDETLQAAPFLLPTTGAVFGRTSKPRSHFLYRFESQEPVAKQEFRDIDGAMLVEFNANKWQVRLPPSVHRPKDGGPDEPVRWDLFDEPALVDPVELRMRVGEVASIALLARHWVVEGGRQDAFLALSGGLLRAGWSVERTERFVQALAHLTKDEEARKRVQTVRQTHGKLQQEKMATGWRKLEELLGTHGKQITQRLRQWMELTSSTPVLLKPRPTIRHIDPYKPFPLETLPPGAQDYVRDAAKAMGCDCAFVALPVMAGLASLIGNTRTIRLKRGWDEPSVLWTLVVGSSGTLKSPACRTAVGPIFGIQEKLLEQYDLEWGQYETELAEYQQAKRNAKDGGPMPDEPTKPVCRRTICSDTTIERVAEILMENPRGILLWRDELAGWFSSFTRYRGSGSTDLPQWLEMHSAQTIMVDRKTGDRKLMFVKRL